MNQYKGEVKAQLGSKERVFRLTFESIVNIESRTNKSVIAEVDTVTFSVVNNDLRFYHDHNGKPGNLNVFKHPLQEIIMLCRQYFRKNVKIIFHSVLPMRCMYPYTAPTFQGSILLLNLKWIRIN